MELLETAARDSRRSDEVLDTMRRVSSSLGQRRIAERMVRGVAARAGPQHRPALTTPGVAGHGGPRQADLDQDVGRVMAAVQALRHQVDALAEAAPSLAREGECAVGATLW